MKTSSSTTAPTAKELAKALSHVARWRMLRELSQGEPREIEELATVGGCSYDSGAKHLRVLEKLGLIVRGRGCLYQIPARFVADPAKHVVDYGPCLLRLDVRP